MASVIRGSDNFDSEGIVTGTAKAWVNFNGTGTVAIRDSYNVSSITDGGTGRYIANYINSLPNSNYSAVSTNANKEGGCYNFLTTSISIFVGQSAIDSVAITLTVHGN